MSATHFALPGSLTDKAPMRHCSRCKTDKPQPGGLTLSATRWVCRWCWIGRPTKERQ